MRSYLVVSGDFVHTGGMDMANFAFASYLADQGNDVHLVTHLAESGLAQRRNVVLHRVAKPLGANSLGAPLLSRQGRAWAAKISSGGGRVVVNGGNCTWNDVNWVHYVHAAYQPQFSGSIPPRIKNQIFHRCALSGERTAMGSARIIICNSQRTKRDVVETLNIPEHRVHVVYYGIDPKRFGPVTALERVAARKQLGWGLDRPIVAFVGELGDRRKNFDSLFSAWLSLCKEKTWDCDLVVVGVGAELPHWRQRASQCGLAHRIKFLGFRKDVPTLLAASDVLVHPARYEAYGLCVHEALCRGLPVILSANAGVAERYPHELKDLLIQNPNDAVELKERLRLWRMDIDRMPALISSFSVMLRSRTWDQMAAQILRIIESAN
jgi:glycosyltransferase involved in cell wall biosynthesis